MRIGDAHKVTQQKKTITNFKDVIILANAAPSQSLSNLLARSHHQTDIKSIYKVHSKVKYACMVSKKSIYTLQSCTPKRLAEFESRDLYTVNSDTNQSKDWARWSELSLLETLDCVVAWNANEEWWYYNAWLTPVQAVLLICRVYIYMCNKKRVKAIVSAQPDVMYLWPHNICLSHKVEILFC